MKMSFNSSALLKDMKCDLFINHRVDEMNPSPIPIIVQLHHNHHVKCQPKSFAVNVTRQLSSVRSFSISVKPQTNNSAHQTTIHTFFIQPRLVYNRDMKFLVLLILVVVGVSGSERFCRQFSGNVKREFHLLRRYQRSNKTVVAVDSSASEADCAEWARTHQGLAFNFSPLGRYYANNRNSNDISQTFHNCEVLDCPEYSNFSSITNDTRFNYYSMYAKILRKLYKPKNIWKISHTVNGFNYLKTFLYPNLTAQHGLCLSCHKIVRKLLKLHHTYCNKPS